MGCHLRSCLGPAFCWLSAGLGGLGGAVGLGDFEVAVGEEFEVEVVAVDVVVVAVA